MIHDYGRRTWGQDVAITKVIGLRVWVIGWGTGIRVGDLMLLPNSANVTGVSQYLVEKIRYYRDPQDMWTGELVHAPEPR